MNAISQAAALVSIAVADLPAIGAPLEGGFYTGRILVPEGAFAIITAGKDGELAPQRWAKKVARVDGASSYYDCLSNTLAMAAAGSALADAAIALRLNGFDDWAIPSRDVAELQYRAFKPTAKENWVFRNGDNPSSFPVGYPYTEDSPKQTDLYAFRAGGPDAFAAEWYWTSTQSAGTSAYAWLQLFVGGYQLFGPKDGDYRARAVRRVAIR